MSDKEKSAEERAMELMNKTLSSQAALINTLLWNASGVCLKSITIQVDTKSDGYFDVDTKVEVQEGPDWQDIEDDDEGESDD